MSIIPYGTVIEVLNAYISCASKFLFALEMVTFS